MTFNELTDRLMDLYTGGKYVEGLEMIERNSDRFPEQAARTTFWKMCLLGLCGRAADVLSIFQRGLDSGLWWAESQFSDSDLDAVRDSPEFKRLVAASQEKYEEARAHVRRDQAILVPESPSTGKYPLLIALHGRNGNKDADLEHWEVACQKGWFVLSPQSTQPLFNGSYGWDDPAQSLADLDFYYEQVSKKYPIDPQRIVIAGFSQGSGMAIYTALKGGLAVRGFIGIGTWWAAANQLAPERRSVRGYFITGEKDPTLNRVREIQNVLSASHVEFDEEVHADLAHEFPTDFETSFDRAIDFIFKEHE